MSDTFEEGTPVSVTERLAAEALIIDVDGFEGPLDLLLMLSRTQKVDLRRISILHLAQQYLAFVEKAKALRIELAADYLVMAAWLAFLKSRLLLPPDPSEEGPSGEELAAHLAFQLERLAAMREAAAQLMASDRLGVNFFARGQIETVERVRRVAYTATLLDLMQAYARIRTRDDFRPFVMDRHSVYTMEQALERMRGLIGYAGGWTDYLAQRQLESAESAPKVKAAETRSKSDAKSSAGLSFTEKHRLEALPSVIDKLGAEIAKLEEFLAQPDLYAVHPAKFNKGTEALVERQTALAAAEEEWLILAEKAESGK